MVVVGFVGPMRSGKTLSMTIEAYKQFLKGRKVYSNYKLSFPYEDVDDQLLGAVTKDNKTGEFDGAVVMLDEVHVYMDSRISSHKKNRLLSYFITQSGKLDSLVLWSSQYFGQVDKRLRLNTQVLFKAERLSLQGVPLRQDDKREDFLVDLHRYSFRDDGKRLGFFYDGTRTLKHPKKYFSLYDTKQRIRYTGGLKSDKPD